jgi:hypothetical protein
VQALGQDGVCFDFLRRLDGKEIDKQTAVRAKQVLNFFECDATQESQPLMLR